jgi:hypothetical protein
VWWQTYIDRYENKKISAAGYRNGNGDMELQGLMKSWP